MNNTIRTLILTPGLVIFLGCLGMCGGGEDLVEGVEPGECSDGADNDGDGLYDCDDPDCAGSSDCDDPTSDTDEDTEDTDTEVEDTDDFWDGELEIDIVEYGYTSSEWSYTIQTKGWADVVDMTITQDASQPWTEEHELENTDFHPKGAWDLWELELEIVSSFQDQTSGESTLYSGSSSMEDSMVWRVEAYEGSRVEDCVVWAGRNADASLLMEPGCRELSF